MTRFLYRSGRWAALHPWRAVAGWLTFTALLLGLAAGFGGTPQDNWNVPGTEAQEGLELLRDHVPGAGNATARVVVHDDEALQKADLAAISERLLDMDHAVTVSEPQ